MQHKKEHYNPKEHDKYFSLSVKQPFASLLLEAERSDGQHVFANKCIEVRSKPTKYRGDTLICASQSPVIPGYPAGCTIGFVELYDIKPISTFTAEDWENTRIPRDIRETIKHGYGWLMRNPRKVIEYPIKGQLGIYTLYYTKGDIMEYPTVVSVDIEDYKLLTKKK